MARPHAGTGHGSDRITHRASHQHLAGTAHPPMDEGLNPGRIARRVVHAHRLACRHPSVRRLIQPAMATASALEPRRNGQGGPRRAALGYRGATQRALGGSLRAADGGTSNVQASHPPAFARLFRSVRYPTHGRHQWSCRATSPGCRAPPTRRVLHIRSRNAAPTVRGLA
jgi:hypothetical protein